MTHKLKTRGGGGGVREGEGGGDNGRRSGDENRRIENGVGGGKGVQEATG